MQDAVHTGTVPGARVTLDQPAKAKAGSEAATGPSAAEDSLQLQLLAKMTGHVATHLPSIWQLVQVITTKLRYTLQKVQVLVPGCTPYTPAASNLKVVASRGYWCTDL